PLEVLFLWQRGYKPTDPAASTRRARSCFSPRAKLTFAEHSPNTPHTCEDKDQLGALWGAMRKTTCPSYSLSWWCSSLTPVSVGLTKEQGRGVEKHLCRDRELRLKRTLQPSSGQEALTDTRRSLTDTRRSLTDTRRSLTDTRRSLTHTRRSLTDTRRSLTHTRRSLTDTRRSLTDTRRSLTHTHRSLTVTNRSLTHTVMAVLTAQAHILTEAHQTTQLWFSRKASSYLYLNK
ncbi:hypothetical protein ANANG_G00200630, partial [Anguilla anguilla]